MQGLGAFDLISKRCRRPSTRISLFIYFFFPNSHTMLVLFSRMAFVQFGGTVLIRAAQLGYTDCVRMLLEAGADTGAKEKVCLGAIGFQNERHVSDNI